MTRHAFDHGVFCIEQIPNQPQVAHCHSFFIHADMRGQGLAKLLKAQQCDALREQGFDYATCTTAGDNVRQHRVLEGLGWNRLVEFPNSNTGGTTIIWGWRVER
jgi:GNAT superfamily N-acetyltransferase